MISYDLTINYKTAFYIYKDIHLFHVTNTKSISRALLLINNYCTGKDVDFFDDVITMKMLT